MLDTPTHTPDEEIAAVITRGINEGKAQSACIWDIIRIEKWSYPLNDTLQMREEWNARYSEIDTFIHQKGLRVPEISPLIDGFRKDIRKLLGLA